MLIAADGKLILRGRVSYVPIGRSDSEWDFVSIARILRSIDYTNMLTSPEYRLLEDSAAKYKEKSVSFKVDTPSRSTIEGPLVVLLANIVEEDQASWIELLEESIVPFDGHIHLVAPISDISSEGMFLVNFLTVLEFPDTDARLQWLVDAERETEFAIVSDVVRNQTALVVDAI